MDFGKLLHVAKQNADQQNVRCYSTKYSPPKKESKDKTLSSGIKRFLAKKEEEEREKERQLRANRERLEAMRDTKSKNKINKMLKVIKSADKSVIEDTGSPKEVQEVGESDDFGYESQESNALYKKLMEKFKTTPEKDAARQSFSSSSSSSKPTKRPPAPVSVAKSKPSSSSTSKSSSSSSSSSKSSVANKPSTAAAAPKPKRPPPPVVNFEQLLKLAAQKQFEPIKVDAPSSSSKKDDRPMSAKEKREHEERQRMAEERKRRLNNDNYDYRKGEPAPGPSKAAAAPANGRKEPPKKNGTSIRPIAPAISSATSTAANSNSTKGSSNNSKPSSTAQYQPSKPAVSNGNGKATKVPEKTRQFPPPDVQRTRSFPPEDVQRRPQNTSRPFPPADVRRRPQQDQRPNPYSSKRSRYEEEEQDEGGYEHYDSEEDEYDSEMDDFIDDGPLGQTDISSCIKEIFGYDKSRYKDEDFDDREMESSFAQQMREESYSRKVGRLEDEADMRQEALDKARKAALKRAASKRH